MREIQRTALTIKLLKTSGQILASGIVDGSFGDPRRFFENQGTAGIRDLGYMIGVLTPEGPNNNGTWFMPDEMLKSYKTARLKPVNLEHDTQTVVGVIYDSCVANAETHEIIPEDKICLDENGEPYIAVPEGEDRPAVEILVAMALYKAYNGELFESIKDMERFGFQQQLSMECWYSDVVFVHNNQVIARTEQSEYLFDYINTEYGGSKVYLAPKNITWGGIAITDNPAQPKSVTLMVASTKGGESMKTVEELLKEVEQLTADLAGITAERDKFKADVDVMTDAIQSLEASVAETETQHMQEKESLSKVIEDLKSACEALQGEFDAYRVSIESEKAQVAKEALVAERLKTIEQSEVSFLLTEAEVQSIGDMEQEAFDAFVADRKAKVQAIRDSVVADLRKEQATKLGLSADATDEQIEEAVKMLMLAKAEPSVEPEPQKVIASITPETDKTNDVLKDINIEVVKIGSR